MKVRSKQEINLLEEVCVKARKVMLTREHERLKIELLAQREREKFEI